MTLLLLTHNRKSCDRFEWSVNWICARKKLLQPFQVTSALEKFQNVTLDLSTQLFFRPKKRYMPPIGVMLCVKMIRFEASDRGIQPPCCKLGGVHA